MADVDRMHGFLGIQRGVVVQPTVYGTDNRLLVDVLRGRNDLRGIAVIDEAIADADLQRFHEAGIRGVRFNLAGSPDTKGFDRCIERTAALGWHIKIGGNVESLLRHEAWLRSISVTAVLDHLAGAQAALGPYQPVCRLALELLEAPHWWMLLSNGDRHSAQQARWTDMAPIAERYIDAAPDRVIWASDWPHLLYAKPAVPNDADLVELLFRYVPDAAARRRILVENPARLYGFDTTPA